MKVLDKGLKSVHHSDIRLYRKILIPKSEVSIMPTIKAEDCVGCGACVDACPQDAITVDDVAVIGADCIDCGACIDECPSGAIVE